MCFFFQAEDGIRDLVRSRGLGDVYKRQAKRSVQVRYATDALCSVATGTREASDAVADATAKPGCHSCNPFRG